jgi:CRP/FNR family cyclic AMP-dependent transcriptional regulator
LAPADLEALATRAREHRYRRGEAVFRKGDPGDSLHVVRDGRIRIVLPSEDGEEVTIAVLGRGEFFGELALLDRGVRSASAVALEDARTVVIARDDFLSWLAERPAAVAALLSLLSRRLRRADELLGDVSFLNVPSRLAKKLVELAEQYGRGAPLGEPVEVRLTQEELASTIGATRESVNKCLKYFKSNGWVAMQKGRIAILDRKALQDQVY